MAVRLSAGILGSWGLNNIHTQNSADLSKLLEELGSSTEWQRVVAASEPPPPPSPTTTFPAVLPLASNTTDEPAIKLSSEVSGGGVSEEVLNLLRQLDSKFLEGSGPSRFEQTPQPPGPSIAAPTVDPLVDQYNMTFAQALPRITQLAQTQKVIEHLRKVRGSNAWLSHIHSSNRSRKSKMTSKRVAGRSAKASRKLNLLG